MPSFITGAVTKILNERRGLQRVEVEGTRAYVLTDLIGSVSVGDEVVMNTTAVELDLGTGGWNVVHWNLSRTRYDNNRSGHIMKLRYTSEQTENETVDERLGDVSSLENMPVVVCFLHSQLPVVAATIRSQLPNANVAYAMTDSAALPYALSDTSAELEDAGVINSTYSVGQAFGARHEAVTLHSALLHAHETSMDVVIVAPGPGVVGTGSPYGYSSVSVASELDTVFDLGGAAICCVRYSSGDKRDRHKGVSHHTTTALSRFAHCQPVAPIPSGSETKIEGAVGTEVEIPDVEKLLAEFGLNVTVMGRGVESDREFFEFAAAAGKFAADHIGVVSR